MATERPSQGSSSIGARPLRRAKVWCLVARLQRGGEETAAELLTPPIFFSQPIFWIGLEETFKNVW